LFDQASDTYRKASALVEQMANLNQTPNLAGLYAEFSVLYFFRSQYDEVNNVNFASFVTVCVVMSLSNQAPAN
jgi:hypothetical protein